MDTYKDGSLKMVMDVYDALHSAWKHHKLPKDFLPISNMLWITREFNLFHHMNFHDCIPYVHRADTYNSYTELFDSFHTMEKDDGTLWNTMRVGNVVFHEYKKHVHDTFDLLDLLQHRTATIQPATALSIIDTSGFSANRMLQMKTHLGTHIFHDYTKYTYDHIPVTDKISHLHIGTIQPSELAIFDTSGFSANRMLQMKTKTGHRIFKEIQMYPDPDIVQLLHGVNETKIHRPSNLLTLLDSFDSFHKNEPLRRKFMVYDQCIQESNLPHEDRIYFIKQQIKDKKMNIKMENELIQKDTTQGSKKVTLREIWALRDQLIKITQN